MVKMITGPEPYLIMQFRQKVKKIELAEINVLQTEDLFSESAQDFLNSMPFCAEKKVLLADVKGMSELDNPLFYNMLSSPPVHCDVYIFAEKVEANRKAYKALQKADAIVSYQKLNSGQLTTFVESYAEHHGKVFTPAAQSLFLSRVNYYDNEQVSLFNVVNGLDALFCVAPGKLIIEEQVEKVIPCNEVDNIFSLASHIRKKRCDEALHELSLLQAKQDYSPIGVLSLLLGEYRIAYKKCILPKEYWRNLPKTAFAGLSKEILKNCLELLSTRIRDIKKGLADDTDIQDVILHLMYYCNPETTM